MRVNRRGTGCGPCPSKQSHQGSPANEGRWQIHFLKKVLEGKNKKYLSFKSRTTSTLFILFVHYPGVSEDRVSRKIFNDSGLQTYANTFLISSPFFLAINSKQYAWIRGPISTRMQSFFSSWQQSHLQRPERKETTLAPEEQFWNRSFIFICVIAERMGFMHSHKMWGYLYASQMARENLNPVSRVLPHVSTCIHLISKIHFSYLWRANGNDCMINANECLGAREDLAFVQGQSYTSNVGRRQDN